MPNHLTWVLVIRRFLFQSGQQMTTFRAVPLIKIQSDAELSYLICVRLKDLQSTTRHQIIFIYVMSTVEYELF